MTDPRLVQQQHAWLEKNASLRMDANDETFPEPRRRIHLDRYEFAAGWATGKRVLDGACGTGYGSDLLARVASSVAGVDCEEGAVAYATRTYGRDTVSFSTSFVEATPFADGSFDLVVSFETVEHTLCPRSHLGEITRLLAPGTGMAILSVPNAWGYSQHHFFNFDRASFAALLEPRFARVEYYVQSPPPTPGAPSIEPLAAASRPAQSLIAVCSDPVRTSAPDEAERRRALLEEIYESAFLRHREYLRVSAAYRRDLGARVWRRLRRVFASG